MRPESKFHQRPTKNPAPSVCLKWIRILVDPKAQFRVRDGKTTLLAHYGSETKMLAASDVADRPQAYDILEALCRTKGIDAIWTGFKMEFVKMQPGEKNDKVVSEPTP